MKWRTELKVGEVRGHVVKAWRKREPDLTTLSAITTDVYLFLLDDGRVVKQEWLHGREYPSKHFVIYRPDSPRSDAPTTEAFIEKWVPSSGYEELTSYTVIGGR